MIENLDAFEIWDKQKSGILTESPLLLDACRQNKFGSAFSYSTGCVYTALFTYLCGKPDEQLFSKHRELFDNRWLVCMSAEWEHYVRHLPVRTVLRIEVMEPLCAESMKQVKPLPERYSIRPFTVEIFKAIPHRMRWLTREWIFRQIG